MLIRVCLSFALFYFGITGSAWKSSEPMIFALRCTAAAGGCFLLAGLWTPVIAALIALNEISIALFLVSPRPEDKWIHVFLAILAAGTAMLGPGAWSIDARLFGRKRVDISQNRGKRALP